jgi:hypothetical protein
MKLIKKYFDYRLRKFCVKQAAITKGFPIDVVALRCYEFISGKICYRDKVNKEADLKFNIGDKVLVDKHGINKTEPKIINRIQIDITKDSKGIISHNTIYYVKGKDSNQKKEYRAREDSIKSINLFNNN